ncbi:hypothetical protein [Levilactobacillus lindianensis]|uniref:hypothetical protein n=1 Tax=Levilactobacillus lindianensis TaxID=2486018 RepID=UPI000F7422FE|nr:hypothetical protein [Levilactobacillus lindianensis]
MSKKIWATSLIVILASLTLTACGAKTTATPRKTQPTTTKPKVKPLTVSELQHDECLTYAAIIYFAVHHTKLPRWQEVADMKAGWQIEIYPHQGRRKYLVWPDQHITSAQKNLAPNWFTLKDQQVIYDSFIVHSFRKDQTATTTLPKIVKQLNRDHAEKAVRHMPHKLAVVNHVK